MARTSIATANVVGHSATPVSLVSGATAADDSNEMMFLNRHGRSVLFVVTPSGASVDVTIDSVADPYGRVGDLGPTTCAASKIFAFGPFSPGLFTQPSGANEGYTYVDIANVTGSPVLKALAF